MLSTVSFQHMQSRTDTLSALLCTPKVTMHAQGRKQASVMLRSTWPPTEMSCDMLSLMS